MIADPQIATLGEFGLFLAAPAAVAVLFGTLLRWRDRRLARAVLQDVTARKTAAIIPTDPPWPPSESVERPVGVDCNSHPNRLQRKSVA
jgi:hypothetical protein